jgi:fructose-bisphosphate aldolase class II
MLVNLKELLSVAEQKGNAVGMFDVPGLECIQAVIGAAEALDEPVILAHAEVHNPLVDIDLVGPAMLAAARNARVPVCVHLDHGESLPLIDKAIQLGFTSVMIDASTRPFDENVEITRQVVTKCHQLGIDVEAELGRMPTREGGQLAIAADPKDFYTDAEEARRFVEETGVDTLAIAFGTAHGFYKERPVLDFDIIRRCRESTGLPLVMHGGSGVSADDYVKAIRAGIRKINYYSYMSRAGYNAARQLMESDTTSFFHDAVHAAMLAMKTDAEKAISVFSRA